MIKKLSILLLFVGTTTLIDAQSLELGGFGGVSYYNGDLNPGVPYNKPKPVGGFVARYSSSTRWAFSSNFTTGSLATDTQFARVQPMLDTTIVKRITELSIGAEFNFLDYFTGSDKDYMSPYVFIGFAVFGHAPQEGPNSFVESLTFNNFSIPFGVGFKYSLSEKLALTVDWKMHKALILDKNKVAGDDFDNIDSPTLYDDPNTNDWYNFTGVSLTYKFNLDKKQKCNSFDNYNIKYK